MGKKSRKRDAEKLSAKVKRLRARVETAEAATVEWEAEARRYEAKATKRTKQRNDLRKIIEAQTQSPAETSAETPARAIVVAGPGPAASDQPDESWTVTRLRALARDAAVPGYSRMTKADLLGELTRRGGR